MSSKVLLGSPRVLNIIGEVDKRTGRVMLTRDAQRWIDDLYRRTGGAIDQIYQAGTSGASISFVWRSDSSGVFPSGNPSQDLLIPFGTFGTQVATRTVTGTLDSTLGTVTLTSSTSTGEETTYVIYGDGTDSARMDITHTASGAVASAGFAAIDNSTAGSTPGTVDYGGGYGGGGGGGPK